MGARSTHTIRVAVLICAAISVISLSGCVSSGPPAETPAIRGEIVTIDLTAEGEGSFLVEGSIEADTQYDRASVRVTGQTRWYDAEGRLAPTGELEIGARVEVWFDGPVAESYPVQATAGAVRVVD